MVADVRERAKARVGAANHGRCAPLLVAALAAWHSTVVRLLVAFTALLVSAVTASAHMMVLPATSTNGAVERYTVLVPTEGKSPTVRVELRIPMGVEVVAIESKPGWQGSNRPFPVGAATVGWAGGRIPPGEMVSFDFLALNPKAPRALTWNATQWYEDGSSDRWGEGASSDHHASTTTLAPAKGGEAPHEGHTAGGARHP
jgi:uncharacterized protein YcnI